MTPLPGKPKGMRLKDLRANETVRRDEACPEVPTAVEDRPLARALMLWADGDWDEPRYVQWERSGCPMPPLNRKIKRTPVPVFSDPSKGRHRQINRRHHLNKTARKRAERMGG